MDGPPSAQGGQHRVTAQQIIDESIAQRIRRWQVKQRMIPDSEVGAQMAAMCWDYDSLPSCGPGLLLPNPKGGYVYLPFYESREGLPPELLKRVEELETWFTNPANSQSLRVLDKMLEKEIDEKCFWEFLDGGSAARIDFHGKIKILAKYRIMHNHKGFDISPTNPHHPRFQFVVTNINEFGHVKTELRSLPWDSTELAVMNDLETFSQPQFNAQTVLDRQLKDLALIHHPEDAVTDAAALIETLKSHNPTTTTADEPEWFYYLCALNDTSNKIPIENRPWLPLRKRPNDVKMMRRLSREQSSWAVVIRGWQLRHYRTCHRIYQLQVRQVRHCEALEAEARKGEERFTEG